MCSCRGRATLEGTLGVALIDDFTPAATDVFRVIEATGGVQGGFHTEELPLPDMLVQPGNDEGGGFVDLVMETVDCGEYSICWDGGGEDLLWGNPFNWSTDLVPDIADTVHIDGAGGTVLVTEGIWEAGLLDSNESIEIRPPF